MVLDFRGTAHPRPDKHRNDPADLVAAEIATTHLENTPLLYEHQQGERIGTVRASWQGNNGELRVACRVDDPEIERQISNGALRGLSLGTGMVYDASGSVLYRAQEELSVCAEGKRPGTWIDTIDGKNVRRTHRASSASHASNLRSNRLELTLPR